MKKRTESLPMPAEDLEALAAHYDTHDTSSEMQLGEWVDPRPMRTTSLRLPSDVVDALKALARERGVRYTTLVREIIESALAAASSPDSQLVEINERLARIEAVVVGEGRRASAVKSRKPSGTTATEKSSGKTSGHERRTPPGPGRSVKSAS